MDLTVAIPTFDRNEVLAQNLKRLLPQLKQGCHILVLDNHSPRPVQETIGSLIQANSRSVKVVRHAVNVGLSGNIIRAIEMCESEWVWLLGDDDPPLSDAIETIQRFVGQHPDCAYFNFASELFARAATIETRGLKEFVERLDSFSSAIFISSSVFHVPTLRANLTWAHSYSYCAVPHFVALLMGLGQSGRSLLSHERIVTWNRPNASQAWSWVDAALRIPTILELPLPGDIRESLGRKVAESFIPPEGIVRQLLAAARPEGSGASARFYYAQIRARRAPYVGALGRIRMACYAPLLWSPRAAGALVEMLAPLLLGSRSNENKLQDRSRAM